HRLLLEAVGDGGVGLRLFVGLDLGSLIVAFEDVGHGTSTEKRIKLYKIDDWAASAEGGGDGLGEGEIDGFVDVDRALEGYLVQSGLGGDDQVLAEEDVAPGGVSRAVGDVQRLERLEDPALALEGAAREQLGAVLLEPEHPFGPLVDGLGRERGIEVGVVE